MFPIKYIDNNLVWNKDNEVFAYYELIPYNYSFLSAEQKFIVHDSFRQLIAQSREGKIHALQIATESSIRSMQEQSKKLVTGKLKEVAYQKIDEQTEALVSMIGDNQVDYRFFLGFKLMVTEEQLNLKNIKKSAWLTFTEFLHEVNHTLMNDFVSMPNDEINRYMKMEKLLENKISRRFKVRRLETNDFGYLIEHLYGRDGVAYEDYEYQLPKKKLRRETQIKYYDLIRPTRCVIEESQRYLRLEHEDKESYVSYFTVNAIVGELDFPSSEIFYFQQQQFTFPVDTSMNVEIVENRKALTTVRNKKKELKDLDNHAYQAGSETSSNVVDALDSVDELETDLDQSKESMYKLSYVIRVSAPDLDELKRRCDEVKDFYDDLNVKLVRPAGDMLGLHSEFLPASKRYINDYVQYVKSDFLAGLGFGATQQLGETTGIYMGYSVDTGRNVYLQPSLASQGVKGTVTPAMSGKEETPQTYNIKLNDVSFAYNNEDVIHNVSCTIPQGSITALVGPSGSGKSTIAKLIARFWDIQSGSITIGNKNIKTINPENLMEKMSFVFQDVTLFNDTVFNNIQMGNPNATKEQVYKAAKVAYCDEFVRNLPNGYDTILGENGSTLSGGERQRISIARALLKDSPIILLDEATASLDPENEVFVQKALAHLIKGKTVIMIAHRLRTVVDADQILVMENGKIVEHGTHNELMERKGLYHKLYSIQQESLGWSV